MDIVLWVVAGLLAATFLASGAMKLIQPKERLVASGMAVLDDLGTPAVKVIGVLEILAAVGLILPAALGVAPVLVPLAAVGLASLMVGAAAMHLRRRETQPVMANLVLLALAVLVAWGRFGSHAFPG
ncbi:DoxX family protein [Micromonospora globbae]|jgi:uncharacterized membrane protein YphA (DoxX/SURF4 family)|uniref:DoxX family protein n=1 Tax=Micromonospora globbae TaxID=1894969 RepID=A0A420F049_9ACTN|nr:DoxX family protein [Micromonospora globbae]RKF26320.1 DoxX family protein [Micromonospora globbae]WTF88019.1 DoxX family protein [Micromonospora globbae]